LTPLQSSLTGPGSRTLLSWARSTLIPTDVHLGVHSRSHLRDSFGRTVPPVRSCSAYAVSHCLDGLLRLGCRGFVAPRCRSDVRRVSWIPDPGLLQAGGPLLATPFTPFEELSSSTAAPRHRGPCLLAVDLHLLGSAGLRAGKPSCQGFQVVVLAHAPHGPSPPGEWFVWAAAACAVASRARFPRLGSVSVVGRHRAGPRTLVYRLERRPSQIPSTSRDGLGSSLAGAHQAAPWGDGAPIREDPHADSLAARRSARTLAPRSDAGRPPAVRRGGTGFGRLRPVARSERFVAWKPWS
jgi:hypothetical protein